jgi:SAM-dependent methyltransferase
MPVDATIVTTAAVVRECDNSWPASAPREAIRHDNATRWSVITGSPSSLSEFPDGVPAALRAGFDRMGLYGEQLLPRFQDKVMARKPNREVRSRVCEGLAGAVVEVGFGTGLNARYYPSEVTKLVAIEPSRVCMRIAEPRIATSSVPIEYGGLTGEHLDLPSGEFEAVLSTWTLCTIPNLEAALGEMRRVLKPGGVLHFVEHGTRPTSLSHGGSGVSNR